MLEKGLTAASKLFFGGHLFNLWKQHVIENQPMTAGIFNHYFAVFTGWAWSPTVFPVTVGNQGKTRQQRSTENRLLTRKLLLGGCHENHVTDGHPPSNFQAVNKDLAGLLFLFSFYQPSH